MATIEKRTRKDGTVAYCLKWRFGGTPERTHRVHQPGDPAVSTVVQLVEDPIAHGGNANDLGLSGLGWPTLPEDGRHRLRILGRRGARLTLRTYQEARARVDRNYYDLPNMDTRATLIRELDNRWTDAA